MTACARCGVDLDDSVGRFGCPNCHGNGLKNPAAVALGKLGGRVRSDAKAEAARANGAKGGRPQEPCVWRLESDLGYTSGCGRFNAIHTDGSFCSYCGHPLRVAR